MIKQNISLLFIFTISLTLGFAQNTVNQFDNNGKRHGLWTKTFKGTNQVRYTGEFNHGKEIDTFKFYTLNEGKSVLSALRIFKEDSDIAEVSFYTSTGGLISKGQMRGKLYVGQWTYFHKNSDVVMIVENFNSNGVLDGPKTVFYKNGQKAEESTYANGKLEGLVSWYGEGGEFFKSLTYKQDILEGPATYYEPGGGVSSTGEYKDNKKWGKWIYYEKGKAYKEINHTTNSVTKLN